MITIAESAFHLLVEEDGGFCLACAAEAHGVEPDAREYRCESCGAKKVYGAEELLLMAEIEFREEAGG